MNRGEQSSGLSEETGRHRDKERQEQTWTERKAGMVREGERQRKRETERDRERETMEETL